MQRGLECLFFSHPEKSEARQTPHGKGRYHRFWQQLCAAESPAPRPPLATEGDCGHCCAPWHLRHGGSSRNRRWPFPATPGLSAPLPQLPRPLPAPPLRHPPQEGVCSACQATYLQPPASRSGAPASSHSLSYSISQRGSLVPARSGDDQTGRRRRAGGREETQKGGARCGGNSRPLPPAPGSPPLQGLFDQKRKRGFSKVEEELKQAGQTRQEQTPARCEWPRSRERSQRILSKQQPLRINCVCARRAGGASTALPRPPWEPAQAEHWAGGGAPSVWKPLQGWGEAGGRDEEGWDGRRAVGGWAPRSSRGTCGKSSGKRVPRWWQT